MGSIRKRCHQFFRALFAGMESEDHSLVDKFLDENEKRLFYRTDPAIQKHCVNVAKTILNWYPYNIPVTMSEIKGNNKPFSCSVPDLQLLVKASLLHDVGKTRGSIRLFDRVFYVISKKLSPELTKIIARKTGSGLFNRLRNAFYVHLHHERIGAEMLANNIISRDIVFLVASHHDESMAGQSKLLALLMEADEIN